MFIIKTYLNIYLIIIIISILTILSILFELYKAFNEYQNSLYILLNIIINVITI